MKAHEKLLGVARLLLGASGADREMCDRRAISSAYYAVFGLFREEATEFFERALGPGLLQEESRSKFSRNIDHAEAKKVATALLTGKKTKPPRPLASDEVDLNVFGVVTLPPKLRKVLQSFGELQDERHTADYNFGCAYSPRQAEEVVATAEDVVRAWSEVREHSVARLFLLMLVAGSFKERDETTKATPLLASAPPVPPALGGGGTPPPP